jgi:hypothetical protein
MKFINTYLRKELEKLLSKTTSQLLICQIEKELSRRDEILLKRQDVNRYPELQPFFH